MALLSLATVLGIVTYGQYQEVEVQQRERLTSQIKIVTVNLERQFSAAYKGLLGVRGDLPAWGQDVSYAAANRRLKALSKAIPGVLTFLLLDAQGIVRASDRDAAVGQDLSKRPYFMKARQNPDYDVVYVSPPFRTVFDVFVLAMAVAVKGPSGEFAGTVAVTMDPEFFVTVLGAVRYAPDMWAAIAHGDGLQFLMEPPRPGMEGLDLNVPGSFFSRHMQSGQRVSVMTGMVHATGEKRIMAMSTIKPESVPMDKPLVLAISREMSAMYEDWRQDALSLAITMAAVSLLTAVSLLIYQRRQRQFLRQAEKAQAALRESELWMRSTFNSLDVAVFVSTPERTLLNCNEAAVAMFGYTPEELRGKTAQILHIDNQHFMEFSRLAQQSYEQSGVARFEYQLRRKNGQIFPTEHAVTLLRSDQGKPLGVLSIVRDISERKQAEESIRILAKFPDENPNPVLRISAQGIITYANEACRLAPGLQECEVGRSALDIMTPGMESVPGYGPERQFELQVGDRYYLFLQSPIADTGDVYLFGQDVTERRQLEHQRQMASVVFDNSIEGIIIADPQGRVQMVNSAYTTITGYAREAVIGTELEIFRSEKEQPDFYQELWESLTRKSSWSGEYWNRRANGEAYPEWLHVILVKDKRGELGNIVVIFHDITDIKTKEERIKHQAFHDALTGLPNRLLFLDRLNQAIARADRQDEGLAVAFLDLDRFKRINDSLGHQAGDILLQETAKRLKGCLRDSDTVSRLGGDEFTMILPDVSRVEEVMEITQRILRAMETPFQIQGRELIITTSIGITFFPADALDANELLKNADLAMYRAKEQGRNNVQMFTPMMNEEARQRLELESRLRQALAEDQFLVYYQPRLEVDTGSLIGMEALVRWQPPDQPLVPPDVFIPLCEETGLILPLGEKVLRKACQETQAWRKMGYAHLCVSVNLSPRQLEQDDLMAMVAGILSDTGLPPAHLELEITESAIMKNLEKAKAKLAALDAMGVRLALDDFGTGLSSLSYLKRFAISALKVDQSFVRDLSNDPNDAAIVLAVIAMGRSLGLQVVAEGVETAEQLAFLQKHGCDEYQGYYFSRPVPAARFQEILRGDN